MDLKKKVSDTLQHIQEKTKYKPGIGLILGSGLGILAEEIEQPDIFSYKDIPNFPTSTVAGHKGQLVLGKLAGKQVICMQGRFHYYEGYSLEDVTYPVRVMQKLGVTKLVVTNAAGGINQNFEPGDLMLIEDHINLLGVNPLRGKNQESFGPRFPDMSEAYNRELKKLALETASSLGIKLQKGVYAGVFGPSYETPAEIRFLRIIGADAVGMSTVPEVIVANHGGIRVLGISCITNMAAGVLDKKLDHEEVMETAEKVKTKFIKLVKKIIENI